MTILHHWPLDEGSGTTATDAVGGSDGTLTNGAAFDSGPPAAVVFDGANDYIELGAIDIGAGAATQMSLCAFFSSDDLTNCTGNDCRIVSKANGLTAASFWWALHTFTPGGGLTALGGRLKISGTTRSIGAASGPLSPGTEYHGALTYDGTTLRIYLDGAEVGNEGPFVGTVSVNAGVNTWIGGSPSGATDKPWDGAIRDVRVYDHALSPAEIDAIINPIVVEEASGTASLAISASAAALSAALATGSTTATFAPSAAASSVAQASGSSAILITATAVPSRGGTGVATGTASMGFTASGAIKAAAQAVTLVTFQQTATFTPSGSATAAATVAGSASSSFSATGSATASASASGAGAFSLGTSAAVTAAASASGAAPLAFTTTATPSATSSGFASGTAPMSFSGAAAASAVAMASASAALTITPAAAAAAVALVTGTASMVFSGSLVSPTITAPLEVIARSARTAFSALLASLLPTDLPTAFDNAPFDIPDSGCWARVRFRPSSARKPQTDRYRIEGDALVSLFCPIEGGTQEVHQLTDEVIAAFRDVSSSGVRFRIPTPSDVGRSGRHWQVDVSCPFRADDLIV
jgi:hypothetical protein